MSLGKVYLDVVNSTILKYCLDKRKAKVLFHGNSESGNYQDTE